MPEVRPDTRVLGPNVGKVVHEVVDGELILINLDRGNYFSLTGSGPQAFSLLSAGVSPAETIDSLEKVYSAADGAVATAVEELVEALLEEGLLQVMPNASHPGDDGAPPSPPAAAGGAEFVPPELEKYTDMQDYLLIDPIHEVGQPGWPKRQAD